MTDSFEEQIERAAKRIGELTQEVHGTPERSHLLEVALEELSTAMEELHVAGEEMHAQNEELAAAQELQVAERRRYEELFEFAPDGYLVTDAYGAILEANHTAAAMFGTKLPRQTRLPLATLAAPDDRDSVRTALSDLLRYRTVNYLEVSMISALGRPFPAALTIAPIRDAQGMLTGVRWAIRDISEQRRLEQALRDANADLEVKVAERTRELRSALDSMETMLHLVTHDLRTPLTIIKGYAQEIETRLTNAGFNGAVSEQFAVIHRAVRRMNVMIQDLVDMARYEGGQLELELQAVELTKFIPELLDRLGYVLEAPRIRLEIPADLPPVRADYDRLERILVNLLSNALKYSDPGTPVTLRAYTEGDEVAIAVSDQGRGIAPDELPHLFERFYRTKKGRKAEGIGLGLYISRLLVETHGGHLEVESALGRGSTFTFTLPRA